MGCFSFPNHLLVMISSTNERSEGLKLDRVFKFFFRLTFNFGFSRFHSRLVFKFNSISSAKRKESYALQLENVTGAKKHE